jgi:hypothetical protein
MHDAAASVTRCQSSSLRAGDGRQVGETDLSKLLDLKGFEL